VDAVPGLSGSPPRATNLNLGVVLRDPRGHPTPPSRDDLQRGLPVRHVVIFCGRCPGTLEVVVEGQVEPNRFVVGRHEVSGERTRFTHNFAAPAYAFLQEEGDPSLPTQELLLKATAARASRNCPSSPDGIG
jgi:hypothetical protein